MKAYKGPHKEMEEDQEARSGDISRLALKKMKEESWPKECKQPAGQEKGGNDPPRASKKT